jgi:hypothetical protein
MATTYEQDLKRARAPVGAPLPNPGVRQAPTAPPTPVSPRTPDGPIASYAAEQGAAPATVPAAGKPIIMATPPGPVGVSPRTPDAATAAYSAELGARGQAPQPSVVPIIAGAIDAGSNIRADVAGAYREGAATSVPAGVGMAAREAIVSPVSRAGGVIANMAGRAQQAAMGVIGPIVEAGRAFITGSPAPAPAAPAATAAPQTGVIRGSFGPAPGAFGPARAPGAAAAPAAAAPAVPGTPQGQTMTPAAQTNLAPRRVPLIAAPMEGTAAPAVDPNVAVNARISELMNDGTWSGMFNAKALARRTDADRAAGVAAVNATSGRMSAESGRIGAIAQMANANTAALREEASAGLITEQTKAAKYETDRRAKVDTLTAEMVNPATKPDRRKEIERQLVAMGGKNPAEPKIHASPIYDALGQKTGEKILERQSDGSWKDVSPKTPLRENAQAMAVVNDSKLSDEDKRTKLKSMGYQ